MGVIENMEDSSSYDSFSYHTALLKEFDVEGAEEAPETNGANKKRTQRTSISITTNTDSHNIGQTVHGKPPGSSMPPRRRMGGRAQSVMI